MAKECQKILQRRIKDFNSKGYIFSPQESMYEFLVKKAVSRQTPLEWETAQEQIDIRCVEDITHALWGTRASAGTVSDLNQKVCQRIETWRNQKIKGHYPYVYLDGIALKHT